MTKLPKYGTVYYHCLRNLCKARIRLWNLGVGLDQYKIIWFELFLCKPLLLWILCLWFRASLIYINNGPTGCNTKQSIYYSASSRYMFRVSPHPSWVHKTVTTASGTGHIFCTVTFLQLGQVRTALLTWLRWRKVAAQKIWPVPEAVVTVLCTPDGGCGWNPKHVGWTCRIINRLFCVASRWTIINIHFHEITSVHYHLKWDIRTWTELDTRDFQCSVFINLKGRTRNACYKNLFGNNWTVNFCILPSISRNQSHCASHYNSIQSTHK